MRELTAEEELILDMFTQACGETDRETGKTMYRHLFISSYENAQYYLIARGIISKDECYYQ